MIARVRNLSARLTVGLLILVPIFVLLGLVLLAPPDGSDRASLMQFIGRLHPLSVHLPIALLVLVPVLELVGRRERFSYLLLSIDFLLGIATFGAIVAAALGWTLARSGGYSGPLVTQHMWAGVFVGAGAWLCWVLRANRSTSEFETRVRHRAHRNRWPSVICRISGWTAVSGRKSSHRINA